MERAWPPGGRASGQRHPRLFPERLTPGFPTALTAVNLAKRAGPATGGEAPDRVLGTRLQPGITFLLLWCSVSDTSWMQEGSRGCGVPGSRCVLVPGVPCRHFPAEASSKNTVHGEEHTRGSPSLRPRRVFSHPCFSPSIYAVGALVFAAVRKRRKLRHHTQEVENPTPAHSQSPGKLGSQ